MTPAEVEQALRIGIEAARRGQKAHARDLLMQVVEADERNEQGWLWLSAVIDSVDDQITALENVLDINPNNESARKGIAYLQSKRPPAPEPEPPPFTSLSVEEPVPEPDLAGATPPFASAALDEFDPEAEAIVASAVADTGSIEAYADLSPIEAVSDLDDPYQCIYCGVIAARELQRCPNCKRSLMVKSGSGRLSPSLRSAVFAIMLIIATTALGALSVTGGHYAGDGALVQYIFKGLGLSFIFGDYETWPAQITPIVLGAQYGLLVALILCMLGIAYQVAMGYYAAIVVLSLTVLWAAYRWFNSYAGPVLAITDMLAAVATLYLVFAAQPDFQVNLVRLRCGVDPRIKGGDALHKLGVIHRRQGEWALAVAHWRAAIAAMPNQPEFYKDLAVGYAQIGYYARALRTLDEYARQAPGDADVETMRPLIEERQGKDQNPKG